MSANLFGDRFLGNREPAWHNIGTVFTDPITASEAVLRANLDYQVTTVPVEVEAFGRKIETGQVAVVREATPDDNQPRVFGFASKNYTVIQNSDLARVIDGLTDEWPVETVGALGQGETVFFTLDAGGGQVGKEDVHQFFLVSDSKKPGSALKIAFTPVRVVCQNTLVSGLRSAVVSAAIPHLTTVTSDLDFRVNLMAQMRKAQLDTLAAMNSLTTKHLVEAQVRSILEAAYPDYDKPSKLVLKDALAETEAQLSASQMETLEGIAKKHGYYNERVVAYRDAAGELLERFNDEHPEYAGTAWAVYNAVVECEDYRKGSDSVFESTLFGSRAAAKVRAFQAAAKI